MFFEIKYYIDHSRKEVDDIRALCDSPCSWDFPKCVESSQNGMPHGCMFSTPNIGVGILEKGRLGMRKHPRRVAPYYDSHTQILGKHALSLSTSPDIKEVLPWLIIHVSLFHHGSPVHNLKFKPLMPREKAIICFLRRRC